jgi:acyl-coenzyme A synthetase/AMP-(fatty) acid ligase
MALFNHLDSYNNRTALIDEYGNSVSYSRLVDDADSIAGKIGRRCIVFTLCENCLESIAGYVGFLRHNIVPILLNNTIDRHFLEELMNRYHPPYLYLPNERAPEVAGILVYQYGAYSLLKTYYEEDYTLYSELALTLTTSGSTGSPKLVRQSYKNIQANTESIIDYLDIIESDRVITTLPMSYTYGLSLVTTHLYKGSTVVLSKASLMEQSFWRLLKKERVTTFGGVPYTYETLKRLHFEKMDLPDLRYLTQAGGKLSKELASEFIAICKVKNIQFIIMYGQTEATARMSYLPWDCAMSKAGSIGVAIPGGQFRLEDDYGRVIKQSEDEAGELIYEGDNVTLGYAEDRFDLAHGDDNRGILHTGDIARRDCDGFYYIVGRKKRFLKLFGNRINLDEIENILHLKGIECACSGKDDQLRIYVNNEENKEKVITFITGHIQINRVGFKVMIINEIPRNDSGKILYSALPELG